jgi:hypothetical protein
MLPGAADFGSDRAPSGWHQAIPSSFRGLCRFIAKCLGKGGRLAGHPQFANHGYRTEVMALKPSPGHLRSPQDCRREDASGILRPTC